MLLLRPCRRLIFLTPERRLGRTMSSKFTAREQREVRVEQTGGGLVSGGFAVSPLSLIIAEGLMLNTFDRGAGAETVLFTRPHILVVTSR